MAYGDVKSQVAALIAATPAGLTTSDIYQRASAFTAGEQSLIRTLLRKLARSGTVLRTSQRVKGKSGKVGTTFRYFPNTPEGRIQLGRFREQPHDAVVAVAQVHNYRPKARSTTRTTQGQTVPTRILTMLKENPTGLSIEDIASRLGSNDGAYIRKTMRILADTQQVHRTRFSAGTGTGRGGARFYYFPRTTAGKAAMRDFLNGHAPASASPTPAPETARRSDWGAVREYHRTEHLTPASPTSGATRTVELLARIQLPDGVHEVSLETARKMKDELVEFFG
jgi:hypothetical protein